jgi:hypothetical protein
MMTATVPLKTKPEKRILSSAEYHKKAANCHFEAAKHHSMAAKHHESGNHNKACEYALKAYWFHCLASEAETEGVKYTAKISKP